MVLRSGLVVLLLCVLGACAKPGESKNQLGFTEVDEAVRTRNFTRLTLLAEQGADFDLPDADGVRPLHRAARDGDQEMCQFLLSHRANPDSVTATGWTPLMLAARDGRSEACEILLRYGATPDKTLSDGRTALHIAMSAGNRDALLSVFFQNWPKLENGKRQEWVNLRNGKGLTALHLAIDAHDSGIISQLLTAGADPNLEYPDGVPPLVAAAAQGDSLTVAALATGGALMTQADKTGRTAYRAALAANNQALAMQIYQWGGR